MRLASFILRWLDISIRSVVLALHVHSFVPANTNGDTRRISRWGI